MGEGEVRQKGGGTGAADDRVEAGSIAASGRYCDASYWLCHRCNGIEVAPVEWPGGGGGGILPPIQGQAEQGNAVQGILNPQIQGSQ